MRTKYMSHVHMYIHCNAKCHKCNNHNTPVLSTTLIATHVFYFLCILLIIKECIAIFFPLFFFSFFFFFSYFHPEQQTTGSYNVGTPTTISVDNIIANVISHHVQLHKWLQISTHSTCLHVFGMLAYMQAKTTATTFL